MEIMEAIKFVAFYGLQSVVIALVGVTLVAGLYQLIRGKVQAAQDRQRRSRAQNPTAVNEPVERS